MSARDALDKETYVALARVIYVASGRISLERPNLKVVEETLKDYSISLPNLRVAFHCESLHKGVVIRTGCVFLAFP